MNNETTEPMAAANANAIAKFNESSELVVKDPFSPSVYHKAADIQAMIASAKARLAARKNEFEALGKLDEAALDAVKAIRKAVKDDDDVLLNFDKQFRETLLDLSGFKAFAVQTRGTGAKIDPLSVRGQFAAMMKEADAVIDASKAKEPGHTYFYAVTCTDKEHLKIQKEIAKHDAGFGCVVPQKDAEWRTAAKLFGIKEDK